jgi:hypothetical protein
MVQTLPDKKAHTKKMRGAETPDEKAVIKAVILDVESTPSNKKLLKELPVGVLLKTEPPMSDADWEEQNIKMILDFEEKLRQQYSVEIVPRAPIFPTHRSQQVMELPARPPMMGVSGVKTQQEINLRGMRGGRPSFQRNILHSFQVGILTLYLSTFDEFRAQARNALGEGLQRTVTYAEHVKVQYLSDNGGKDNE